MVLKRRTANHLTRNILAMKLAMEQACKADEALPYKTSNLQILLVCEFPRLLITVLLNSEKSRGMGFSGAKGTCSQWTAQFALSCCEFSLFTLKIRS